MGQSVSNVNGRDTYLGISLNAAVPWVGVSGPRLCIFVQLPAATGALGRGPHFAWRRCRTPGRLCIVPRKRGGVGAGRWPHHFAKSVAELQAVVPVHGSRPSLCGGITRHVFKSRSEIPGGLFPTTALGDSDGL